MPEDGITVLDTNGCRAMTHDQIVAVSNPVMMMVAIARPTNKHMPLSVKPSASNPQLRPIIAVISAFQDEKALRETEYYTSARLLQAGDAAAAGATGQRRRLRLRPRGLALDRWVLQGGAAGAVHRDVARAGRLPHVPQLHAAVGGTCVSRERSFRARRLWHAGFRLLPQVLQFRPEVHAGSQAPDIHESARIHTQNNLRASICDQQQQAQPAVARVTPSFRKSTAVTPCSGSESAEVRRRFAPSSGCILCASCVQQDDKTWSGYPACCAQVRNCYVRCGGRR